MCQIMMIMIFVRIMSALYRPVEIFEALRSRFDSKYGM